MNILCIETSASLCSVAIVKNEEIIYCEKDKPMAHAELLMDLINDCLKQSGLEIKELEAVALSGGPGSYTGLRIGCSSAKGICYALNIPLIVIDTLKIIAFATRQKNSQYQYFWAMIDARRMEVYHSIYNYELKQVGSTQNGIVTSADFVPEIARNNSIVLGGDGASKTSAIINIPDGEVVVNALAMCELAKQCFTESDFVDVAYYEPFYLKQANITVSKS